ncbi:MAG: hypothetical protein ACREJO_00115 [Phycisphaerales bacterium]
MIDPTIDPVFSNPELQKLLVSFGPSQMTRIANDFQAIDYTYTPVQYRHENDPFTPMDGAEEVKRPGFFDVATSAAILQNFTGRAVFKGDQALQGFYPYRQLTTSSAVPEDPTEFSVDGYFNDKRTRQHLASLKNGVGESLMLNWIAGNYDGIKRESELFAVMGFDVAEAEYRDVAARAEGPAGFLGNLIGASADPAAIVGGAALYRVGGAAVVGFNAAKQTALAAELSRLGVTIYKTDSVATAASKAILAGTAYRTVSETGLHALDPKRTWEETANNFATGVLMDGVLASGLGFLGGRPVVKPTVNVEIKPTFPEPSLGSIDNDVAAAMKKKIDVALSDLMPQRNPLAEAPRPALTTGQPLMPDSNVPVSAKDVLVNYARKLQEDATAQAEQGAARSKAIDEAAKTPSIEQSVAQTVRDVVEGIKPPDDFNAVIEEVLAAKKAAQERNIKTAADELAGRKTVVDPLAADESLPPPGPEGSKTADGGTVTGMAETDVPPPEGPGGGAQQDEGPLGPSGRSTTGYSDYLPDLPADHLTKLFTTLDKYVNNRLFGGVNVTVHAAQFSTNPQVQMLYQKVFRTIFPSKAATLGLIDGRPPLEAIQGMIRKKGLSVQTAASDAFREYVKTSDPTAFNTVMTNHLVGRELWSMSEGGRGLLLKENAWYELLDYLRVARADTIDNLAKRLGPENFARVEARIKVFEDAGQMAQASKEAKVIVGAMEEGFLREIVGQDAMDRLAGQIDPKGMTGNPKLWEAVSNVLDNNLSQLGQIRTDLRPPALYASKTLEAINQRYNLEQTAARLPGDMTLGEFHRFWNAATGKDWTLENMLLHFLEKKAISADEVANPTDVTVNRLRNEWYNRWGGFVSKEALPDVLALNRADGTKMVTTDFRRSLGLHIRMLEMMEAARGLHDYLEEASRWDGRLREQIRVGGNSVEPVNLLHTYNELDANRIFTESFVPQHGFFQELRQWTESALQVIQKHMSDTAIEHATMPDGTPITQAVREREGELITKMFDNVRSRLSLTSNSSSSPSTVRTGRNLFAFTRNLFLSAQGLTNLHDIANGVATIAFSPFKGDIQAAVTGLDVHLRNMKRSGKSMGALLDNMEFVADELRGLVMDRTSMGEYSPQVGMAESLDRGNLPQFTFGDRLASWQEHTAGKVIETLSLGQAVLDTQKSINVFSTIHQLASKEGLIVSLDNALKAVNEGMDITAAMDKHNVPGFWGKQALRYLSGRDINELADLIRADVGKDVSFPRRFGLTSLPGEKEIRVLDLPEHATVPQSTAMEHLAMLANDLATREKTSLPGWGEDILGANNVWKQLASFWFRPTTGIFNRAFMGQANKPIVARLGVMGTMILMAGGIDLIKAFSNGDEAYSRKLDEINNNFHTWLAGRIGWSGSLGWAGEKGLNIFAALTNPQPQTAVMGAPGVREITPAPLSAAGTGFSAVAGLMGLPNGSISQTNSTALWKTVSATGFANDTLTFRLMGRLGRGLGVYGDENNSADIRKYWDDTFGVKGKGKR